MTIMRLDPADSGAMGQWYDLMLAVTRHHLPDFPTPSRQEHISGPGFHQCRAVVFVIPVNNRGGGVMANTTTKATARKRGSDRSGGTDGPPFRKPPWPKAYSFALVTGALFLFSWLGQFVFQIMTESNEAQQHGQSFSWSDFFPQFFQSTFENWQSEFLQLVWQVVGLAVFYYWGSSQSRESDERIEAKLDALLRDRNLDPDAP